MYIHILNIHTSNKFNVSLQPPFKLQYTNEISQWKTKRKSIKNNTIWDKILTNCIGTLHQTVKYEDLREKQTKKRGVGGGQIPMTTGQSKEYIVERDCQSFHENMGHYVQSFYF